MEEVPSRTSLAPLASPCVLLCLIGVETEGLLDYQGRAGDHFHCAVESSPGHIRCWHRFGNHRVRNAQHEVWLSLCLSRMMAPTRVLTANLTVLAKSTRRKGLPMLHLVCYHLAYSIARFDRESLRSAVLNAVVHINTQLRAKERKRAQMSAKECKRKSAKERARVQKGAEERKRALPRKNCKQPGLKQPGLGTPNESQIYWLFDEVKCPHRPKNKQNKQLALRASPLQSPKSGKPGNSLVDVSYLFLGTGKRKEASEQVAGGSVLHWK